MTVAIFILAILAFLISCGAIVLIWRFNKYVQNTLEEKLEETQNKVEELRKSLQIATKEGLLDLNGKIRKPYI